MYILPACACMCKLQPLQNYAPLSFLTVLAARWPFVLLALALLTAVSASCTLHFGTFWFFILVLFLVQSVVLQSDQLCSVLCPIFRLLAGECKGQAANSRRTLKTLQPTLITCYTLILDYTLHIIMSCCKT